MISDEVSRQAAHHEKLWQSSQKILRYVNRTHGLSYSLTQRLAGGRQGGAYLLTDEGDQHHAVLKWDRRKWWADRVNHAAPLVAQARDAGWSTPAWRVVGNSPSGYPYVLQDFLEAAPSDRYPRVNCEIVEAALQFVQSQANIALDTDVNWTAKDWAIVFDPETTPKNADTLRSFSETGAKIVDELQLLTAPFRNTELPTSDLVHGDFHPRNLLFSPSKDCTVIAAIDVEALGRGTYFHDVANMAGHCILWPGQSEAVQIIDRFARAQAEPGVWEVCVAARLYELLRLYIEFSKADDVSVVLDRAAAFLELVKVK